MNFETLQQAFLNGDAALMECQLSATGEPVAVVCAANRHDDGSVEFAPFAMLFPGSDEGDYWEKRDIKALAQEVGEWNEHIAGLVGKMKDMFGGNFEAPITEFPDFEHLEAKGRKHGKA